MDEWTFRKRLTVGVLLAGLLLVAFDAVTGAEWLAAAMGLLRI